MVGATGARGWGVERIQVVDHHLAPRFRAALWAHTLRSPLVLRRLLVALGVAAVAVLVRAEQHHVVPLTLLWWLLCVLLAVGPAAYAAIVLTTMRRHEAWLAREVVPGRFIAVTVGQESIRVRDHDSSVEYRYSLVTGVHQYADVVVIEHDPSLWTLPVEVFEAHELSVIRARAGRTFLPSAHGTPHRPLDVAGEAMGLRRSQRLGRLVR